MATILEEKVHQKDSNLIPRYVINCSAESRDIEHLEPLSTEKILSKISGKIYGYGLDIYDEGFEAVDYSLRGITNHFISGLHASFMNHLPFQLRPDDIWIILAQGIATHITLNAEKLRKTFVDFDDKKEITVRDDKLNKKSQNNDWSFVLNQFEKGCRSLSNDKVVDLITSNFSTTSITAKAASQCVLFKALSVYINFQTMTCSGIPQITLVGSVQDWKKIQKKCVELEKMKIGLEFWLQHVLPIMNNIVETVVLLDKNPKAKLSKELCMFWDSIYTYQSMSGGSSVTGWSKTLFPYLQRNAKNNELDWTKYVWPCVSPGDFPATYSMCPMKWNYFGKIKRCGMYGGIFGIAQHKKTGCIAPVIGWMIGKRSYY